MVPPVVAAEWVWPCSVHSEILKTLHFQLLSLFVLVVQEVSSPLLFLLLCLPLAVTICTLTLWNRKLKCTGL